MKSQLLCFSACIALAAASCTSSLPVQGSVKASELEAKTINLAPKYRAATVAITRVGMGGNGSGVIISADGYVMTACHVVEKSGNECILLLNDGRKVKGKVLGIDRKADAALVKISDEAPAGGWPFVPVAKTPPQGAWVCAMGHSGGVVLNRPPPLRLGRVYTHPSAHYIGTDCTVVSGDSGGPLFDLEGNVVGINANISMDIDGNNHVPGSLYLDHMETLKKTGEHSLPRLKPSPAELAVKVPAEMEKHRSLVKEQLEKLAPGKSVDKAMIDRVLAGSKFNPATGEFKLNVDPETASQLGLNGAPPPAAPGGSVKVPAEMEQFRGIVQQNLEKLAPGKTIDKAMIDRVLAGSNFDPKTKAFKLAVDPETAKQLGLDKGGGKNAGSAAFDKDQFIRGLTVLNRKGDERGKALYKEMVETGRAGASPEEIKRISEAAKEIPRPQGDSLPDYMLPVVREDLARNYSRKIGRKIPAEKIDAMAKKARYNPKTGEVSLQMDLGVLKSLGLSPKEMRSMSGSESINIPAELRDNGPYALSLMQPAKGQGALEIGNASTVSLFSGEEKLALGTVISAEGLVVTKASQLGGQEKIQIRLPDGSSVPAQLVGIDNSTDLALFDTRTIGLKPVTWAEESPILGSWLLAPGVAEDGSPSVAIVSVDTRPLPRVLPLDRGLDRRALLGIAPDVEKSGKGYIVGTVAPDSAAEKAGLQVGDTLLEVEGKKIEGLEMLGKIVADKSPGTKLPLKIKRGEAELILTPELQAPGELGGGDAAGVTDLIGQAAGDLSKRRTDFPAVFQHDGVVWANACGGPVLDLHGRCVGLNIARFDRICTFALPAKEVQSSVKRILDARR
ncbi:MAG: putative periplasmic serine endoprotease DegP-like precursor [Verrucomicrobiota bacterium]|jgi:serine protease Do